MAYPHKWSPISYKSSAGQRKHIGQRPMLYRWTTQPGTKLQTETRKLLQGKDKGQETTTWTVLAASVMLHATHHCVVVVIYCTTIIFDSLPSLKHCLIEYYTNLPHSQIS